MSNLAFVSFKKNIDVNFIYEEVCQINKDRFDDLLDIKKDKYSVSIDIFKTKPEHEHIYGLDIYFPSKRKISIKHPDNQYFSYVLIVITGELSSRFNGLNSDESFDETWKSDVSKYPSFDVYFDKLCSSFKKDKPILFGELKNDILSDIPKELWTK